MLKINKIWWWGGFSALAVIVTFMLGHNDQTPIAFVNMKAAISRPLSKMASQLTPSQQRTFVSLYNQALPNTLAAYAKSHHVNLVTATTLFDYSGIDVTDQIIAANLASIEHG